MAYQTYTTEALVCGTWAKNTSDRSYLLFTKEAGMLYADARSVREEKSKQRYALQDFAHIKVSLVKGKSGWRVGSVQARVNYFTTAEQKLARGSIVSVCRFLRRFIKGEEAAPDLFEYVVRALRALSTEVVDRQAFEDVVKLRILAELGYVDKRKLPAEILSDELQAITLFGTNEKTVALLLEQATLSSQL